MSVFDMFSPETILARMGIQPAELLAEYNRWQAEFNALKAGARAAAAHYDARCDLLEKQQTAILAALHRIEAKERPGALYPLRPPAIRTDGPPDHETIINGDHLP